MVLELASPELTTDLNFTKVLKLRVTAAHALAIQ